MSYLDVRELEPKGAIGCVCCKVPAGQETQGSSCSGRELPWCALVHTAGGSGGVNSPIVQAGSPDARKNRNLLRASVYLTRQRCYNCRLGPRLNAMGINNKTSSECARVATACLVTVVWVWGGAKSSGDTVKRVARVLQGK